MFKPWLQQGRAPAYAQFQSLGRDSGCSSQQPAGTPENEAGVSIPRSGFWVFKPRGPRAASGYTRCFNPSVGILGVQAVSSLMPSRRTSRFQSLGRDSGCSSRRGRVTIATHKAVSIPRSGFWVFKRADGKPNKRGKFVSIPRSGFWVFKPLSYTPVCLLVCCFNPSVGILGVQARRSEGLGRQRPEFQSLGRDSGCSSSRTATRGRGKEKGFNPSVGILGVQASSMERDDMKTDEFQSLGRDSGCSSPHRRTSQKRRPRFQSLGRDSGCSSEDEAKPNESKRKVSIPRSGFWVFKHDRYTLAQWKARRFNPSVGILGVQAILMVNAIRKFYEFQSLGRDSGCSSSQAPPTRSQAHAVSIPRSGFWVFKHTLAGAIGSALDRFNPSVGILGVQAFADQRPSGPSHPFQSLGRDSGCSSPAGDDVQLHPSQFQSLGRDSGCSSGAGAAGRRRKPPVSIPRSGFWVFKPGHHAHQVVQRLVSIPRSGFWVFKRRGSVFL